VGYELQGETSGFPVKALYRLAVTAIEKKKKKKKKKKRLWNSKLENLKREAPREVEHLTRDNPGAQKRVMEKQSAWTSAGPARSRGVESKILPESTKE